MQFTRTIAAGAVRVLVAMGVCGCGASEDSAESSDRTGGATGGGSGGQGGSRSGGKEETRPGGQGGAGWRDVGGGIGGAGGGEGGSGGTNPGGGSGELVIDECNPRNDLAKGLIGYWKFDEESGNSVTDASGSGNVATVVEGGTSAAGNHPGPTWVSGKKGGGLQLDGVDDWIRVADSDSLDSTGTKNGLSITAWVKVDSFNTVKDWNFLVVRHELGSRLEHFGMGMFQGLPAGQIHFFGAIGPQNVPIGEWVHLAQTYDGITQRVYMNGVEVTFLDVGWPISADETPLTIGAGINEEDVIENIAGTLDEVRIYNRELTPCEVQETFP